MDIELTPEQKLAQTLSSPDYILEPHVLNTLRDWFKTASDEREKIEKISRAIAFLNNNYQGVSSMSNLVAGWLDTVGVSSAEIQNISEDYVSELVLQRFDLAKADRIMDVEETPEWLDELIPVSKWRNLIYTLSQKHRKCDLLNWYIQGISGAGYHTEIAALESASIYLSVFNRVLGELTTNILKSPSEREFQKLLPSFKQMCNHNEHTYTYAQSILYLLSKEPNGVNVRRLSQELYNELKDIPLVQQLAILIDEYEQYPEDLRDSISAILRDQEVSQGNCKKLYALYAIPPGGAAMTTRPPPVRYIRQGPILHLFMKELLGQNKVQPPYSGYYYHLLAYSSCKSDSPELTEREATEIQNLTNTLNKLLASYRPQLVGIEFNSFSQQLLQEVHHPLISMYALHWIGLSLRNQEFYSTNSTTGAVEYLMDLLYEISRLHQSQHLHVLELEAHAFESLDALDGEESLQLRRTMLDAMVYLMECGCVMSVLDQVMSWAKGGVVDLSLIRYFTTKVLEMAGPPFSNEFLSVILPLVQSLSPSISVDANYIAALTPFLEHLATLDLPLSQKQIVAAVSSEITTASATPIKK